MRVLFLRSNPVDPDSRVEKEVNSLLKDGHAVEIFAWDRSSDYEVRVTDLKILKSVVPIHRIGIKSEYSAGFKKNLIPLIRFQLALLSFLVRNRKQFDAVHACDFDTAYIASKVCNMFDIKLIYDIFDYYVDSFSVPHAVRSLIERMDQKVINGADAVIICSEQRTLQIAGAQPRKLVVIHNSPSLELLEGQIGEPANGNCGRIVVGYVGILAKGRALEQLLDFIAANNDFELRIGGFGILEELVESYSIAYENIYFMGKLQYEETLKAESSCDLLVAFYDPKIRNHVFAAPNKFYESLMLGKPVLMADGSGMASCVAEQGLGYTSAYSNLGEALLAAKADRDNWNEISVRERRLYQSNYSWGEMDHRLRALYDSLS